MSKTPKFDAVLDQLLSGLIPGMRTCVQCGASFALLQEDVDLLKLLRVPPSVLCPLCRKIERFAHLMRVLKFYKKKCSAPGHEEEVISTFPPSSPHIVYDYAYWNSDAWDAAAYGVECDVNRPFFEQFKELYFRVPQCCLDRDVNGVNSEYSVGGLGAKNAYYCAMAHHAENVSYCLASEYSRDCVDLTQSRHDELCYELVLTDRSNSCKHCVDCDECLNSFFLYDCKNCNECFMSSNVRNRSYVFRNAQFSKEEYRKKMGEIALGKRSVVDGLKREFDEMARRACRRATWNTNVSNVVGDHVTNGKNCYMAFQGIGDSENVRYIDNFEYSKDCMDATNAAWAEKVYASVITKGNNVRFCISNRNVSDLEYCSSCHNSRYCFGCVGIKSKQFYIFNKPYGEEEYWGKVDEIKAAMMKSGEYGRFFPVEFGLLPYQASAAQKWFPLSPEEAKRKNIPWYEEPETTPPNLALFAATDVPDDIADVKDDILDVAIVCEKSGKPFRIIPSELSFYRANGIPVPVRHPQVRLLNRSRYEHSIWLYPFACGSCGKDGMAAFSPEQQKDARIVCEACYQREVV